MGEPADLRVGRARGEVVMTVSVQIADRSESRPQHLARILADELMERMTVQAGERSRSAHRHHAAVIPRSPLEHVVVRVPIEISHSRDRDAEEIVHPRSVESQMLAARPESIAELPTSCWNDSEGRFDMRIRKISAAALEAGETWSAPVWLRASRFSACATLLALVSLDAGAKQDSDNGFGELRPPVPGYSFQRDGDDSSRFRASNPEHGLCAIVASDGTKILAPERAGETLALSFRLAAIGRAHSSHSVEAPVLRSRANRLELVRTGLVEWYVNDHAGLEHGFTLEVPPDDIEGRRDTEIEILLDVGPGTEVEIEDHGNSAELRRPPGDLRVLYSGLRAWDATGMELDARLEARAGALAILVDDERARYPIEIDPLIVVEEAVVAASDGAYGDEFGWGLAIQGETMFVGAPGDDDDRGAVYVFERQAGVWTQVQKLQASDGSNGDSFGNRLDADGARLVVGARNDDSGAAGDAGAAYVFVESGGSWTEEAKLLASDAVSDDWFGLTVAISGDTIVVGTVHDDTAGGMDTGSVYVFERDMAGWSETAHLIAFDAGPHDNAGQVAIEGDLIVVGAARDDVWGALSGSAYVYRRVGGVWSIERKLAPDDGSATDRFGQDVAITGGRIVIGAPGDHDFTYENGAVYVFAHDGLDWVQTGQFYDPHVLEYDNFGAEVDAVGDRIVVGEPGDDEGYPNGGALLLFELQDGAWTMQAKMTAGDVGAGAFGYHLAMDSERVIAGGPTLHGTHGRAHVYLVEDAGTVYCTCPTGPCANPDPGAGCANSTGSGGLLHATRGTPSVAADDLVLSCTQLPPNQATIFFMGAGQIETVFGDGLRCVGSGGVGIFRYYPPGMADASGRYELGPGIVAYSQGHFGLPGSIAAGSTWFLQGWYRDPMGPCGSAFNLTNGLATIFAP